MPRHTCLALLAAAIICGGLLSGCAPDKHIVAACDAFADGEWESASDEAQAQSNEDVYGPMIRTKALMRGSSSIMNEERREGFIKQAVDEFNDAWRVCAEEIDDYPSIYGEVHDEREAEVSEVAEQVPIF